jgi:hypothetical protein
MANIIASGKTQASSLDFTVTAGTPTTILISSAAGAVSPDARASIQQKAASGAYVPLGELNVGAPAFTIFGAGTFRVVRQACSNDFAVDRD